MAKDRNDKAYERGVKAGQKAGLFGEVMHGLANIAADGVVGATGSKSSREYESEEKGYKYGLSHKPARESDSSSSSDSSFSDSSSSAEEPPMSDDDDYDYDEPSQKYEPTRKYIEPKPVVNFEDEIKMEAIRNAESKIKGELENAHGAKYHEGMKHSVSLRDIFRNENNIYRLKILTNSSDETMRYRAERRLEQIFSYDVGFFAGKDLRKTINGMNFFEMDVYAETCKTLEDCISLASHLQEMKRNNK